MRSIAWSIGLQSRAAVQLGQDPDMEEVARTAFENGVQEAIIFGKDHTGFCFHPTRYGVMHPTLTINLTKGLSDAMHRHGIRTIAYVNFGMDGEAGRRRRDWLQEESPGKPSLITPDHYANLCLFTSCLDEYMLPVVKEILLECDADGIFFDTMSAFDFCACPVCRNAFQTEFGKELPLTTHPEDPSWDLYSPWHYQRVCRCIGDIRRQIHEWKPEATVIFNHLGGPAWPFPLPGVLKDVISCDPPAFFPWISMYASYMSSLPVTGDVFIERFARGWGDRNANSDLTMRYKSAAIFAHRQRFCVGDRIHPDWRLAPGSKSALRIIRSVWRVFHRALPDSLQNAADFLLLHPESCKSGHAKKSFKRPSRQGIANPWMTTLGAFRMLLDCGRSFLVLPEMALESNLSPGRLLIIPAAEYLKPETDTIIRTFVAGGGSVLLADKVPRLNDNSLPDWCGFSSVEEDTDSQCLGALYLPDLGSCRRKKDNERPLVRSNVCKLGGDKTEAVLFGYSQDYGDLFRKTPYASYYMSSEEDPMTTPLLTRFQYGKGTVWFLNCSLFADYADSALAVHKQWMENLLRRIHPRAAFELVSPAGDVEIISFCNPVLKETVHVLLNHGGRRNSLRHLFTSEQVVSPQPAFPVTLKIRSGCNLRVTVNGKRVQGIRKGAFFQIPLVMDSLWKIVYSAEAAES